LRVLGGVTSVKKQYELVQKTKYKSENKFKRALPYYVNAAINIKRVGLEQYCKNKTGKPLPEEPVESSALAGAMKQEIPLSHEG